MTPLLNPRLEFDALMRAAQAQRSATMICTLSLSVVQYQQEEVKYGCRCR